VVVSPTLLSPKIISSCALPCNLHLGYPSVMWIFLWDIDTSIGNVHMGRGYPSGYGRSCGISSCDMGVHRGYVHPFQISQMEVAQYGEAAKHHLLSGRQNGLRYTVRLRCRRTTSEP
ncbi:unnamed protein product, partial [Sphacelaria rigidula]